MKLLLRLFCCLGLLATLPHLAHAQLEELGEAGESDFNPLNPKPNYRRTAVGWEKHLPPDSARRYRARFTPAVVSFRGPASLVQALPNPYPVRLLRDDADATEVPIVPPARIRASVKSVSARVTRR